MNANWTAIVIIMSALATASIVAAYIAMSILNGVEELVFNLAVAIGYMFS